MYYKLNDNYILRGWEMLPAGYVDLTSGRVGFLPPETYRLLKFCTGMLDSDSILFSDNDRMILEKLCSAGLVRAFPSIQEPITGFQEYRAYDSRFLAQVHWSITGRCNYNCRHCYMSAPHGVPGETALQDCQKTIDEFAKCGIFRVSLTGGEALVHPDFWKIVDMLREKHITVTAVYSNGALINERTLGEFEKRDMKPEIQLSFDGTDGEHEWLRNVKGADRHIENALRICREHGFATGAEFCLHKGNVHTLRESVNYLAALGCKTLKVTPLMAAGEGLMLADQLLSAEEAYSVFLDYIPHFYADGEKLQLMLGGLFMSTGPKKYIIPSCKAQRAFDPEKMCVCGHARNVMYLSPDGRVLPCLSLSCSAEMEKRFEKISETGLEHVLNDSFYFTCIDTRLSEYFTKHPECGECAYRFQCAGGCRGLAVSSVQSDDFLEKDMESCVLFKGGYYSKMIKLAGSLGLT